MFNLNSQHSKNSNESALSHPWLFLDTNGNPDSPITVRSDRLTIEPAWEMMKLRIFYNLIKVDAKWAYNGVLVLSFDTSSNVRNLDTRHKAGVDENRISRYGRSPRKSLSQGAYYRFTLQFN